jgi:hypothetical protein
MSSAAAQNSTTNITIDANYDVLKYVNQLIGSNNGGKIFWGGSRLKL